MMPDQNKHVRPSNKMTRSRFAEIWIAGGWDIVTGRLKTLSHLMQKHEVQEVFDHWHTMPVEATFVDAFHALWREIDPQTHKERFTGTRFRRDFA